MVDIVFPASGFRLFPLWCLLPSSFRILHAAWIGDKDFPHSRAPTGMTWPDAAGHTELIFQPGHGAFAIALIVAEDLINRDAPAGQRGIRVCAFVDTENYRFIGSVVAI
jgi:hypothetical protein